jgi:GLPGLI family protein
MFIVGFLFINPYIYTNPLNMKSFLVLYSIFLSFNIAYSQHSMIIGDCTITYKISGSDVVTNNNLSGVTKILYVKAKMARVDMIGSNYKQSIIYDNASGSAIILKEIGNEKYISNLTADEWKGQNEHFDGQTITFTNDKKSILGYDCKKAIARLKDGSSYNIYYTDVIAPSAIENPFQFKDIPGFVLEYETGENNTSKITYSATSINFDPVPTLKFEIPKSGYRVLK